MRRSSKPALFKCPVRFGDRSSDSVLLPFPVPIVTGGNDPYSNPEFYGVVKRPTELIDRLSQQIGTSISLNEAAEDQSGVGDRPLDASVRTR